MTKKINYLIKHIDDISRFRVEIEALEPCYQRTILEFLIHEFEKFDFNKVQIQADIIGDFDFCIFISDIFVLWINVGDQTQLISIYGTEHRWDEKYSNIVLENFLFPIYREIFEGKYRAILRKHKDGTLFAATVYFKGISESQYTLFSSSSEDYLEEVMGVSLYKL